MLVKPVTSPPDKEFAVSVQARTEKAERTSLILAFGLGQAQTPRCRLPRLTPERTSVQIAGAPDRPPRFDREDAEGPADGGAYQGGAGVLCDPTIRGG